MHNARAQSWVLLLRKFQLSYFRPPIKFTSRYLGFHQINYKIKIHLIQNHRTQQSDLLARQNKNICFNCQTKIPRLRW